MNLALRREDQFLKALQALGPREFTTKEAHGIGATCRMTRQWVRKALSVMEKADRLVRLDRGVYMTWEAYAATQNGMPGSRSSP